jgi:hypothetical protein
MKKKKKQNKFLVMHITRARAAAAKNEMQKDYRSNITQNTK